MISGFPGEWIFDGKCATQQMNPEWFFTQGKDQQVSKKLCEGCPVLEQCRKWALDNYEQWGVWGGLTERERHKIWGTKAFQTVR